MKTIIAGAVVLADYVLTWKRNPSHYGEYLKEVTYASKKKKTKSKRKTKPKSKKKKKKNEQIKN